LKLESTYVVTLVDIQVSVHIPLVSTPNGAGHARPGLLKGQNTLHIVAGDLFTGDRVDDSGFNTKEGKRSTAGLGGGDTAKRGDHVRTSLGLPVSLNSTG